ncbi:hypothetical protein AUJ62_03020 [Candidatus Pacearchaeota archaeon CG1_02_32_21]|nr:MAG: hypothetical protein AUJ62_03020 [Candidatus Pacearchaeota archaeon CG1_02_32_21]
MEENRTQLNPQFILWIKEAGVFRPAELKMPENYMGYELEKNVELGSQDISPDSLNLMSAVYLGPINIFEEQLRNENIITKDAFQRLHEHYHGVACGIVKCAENVAKEQGVSYFGVNIVQTEKDRTWKFKERKDFVTEKFFDFEEKYSFLETSEKSKKPLEFVLHPTAQLYVPRK